MHAIWSPLISVAICTLLAHYRIKSLNLKYYTR